MPCMLLLRYTCDPARIRQGNGCTGAEDRNRDYKSDTNTFTKFQKKCRITGLFRGSGAAGQALFFSVNADRNLILLLSKKGSYPLNELNSINDKRK